MDKVKELFNNKKTWYILAGLFALYMIYRKRFEIKNGATNLWEKITDRVGGESGLDKNLVLSKGAKGAEVSELQRLIKKEDASQLPIYGIDGIFGSETEDALNILRGVKQISINDFNSSSRIAHNTGISGGNLALVTDEAFQSTDEAVTNFT